MINQVFRAFWKFTFLKVEGKVFEENRIINRNALRIMLNKHCESICKYIRENVQYFSIAQDSMCLLQACALLAFFPQVYSCLEDTTKHQLETIHDNHVDLIKWFITGDLEQHVASYRNRSDEFPQGLLQLFERICTSQGSAHLFPRLLIKHYARSASYASAKTRFDEVIEPNLHLFSGIDFIELIDVINGNRQIYEYGWQKERNDLILEMAKDKLPAKFDLTKYEHFSYTKPEEKVSEAGGDQVDKFTKDGFGVEIE